MNEVKKIPFYDTEAKTVLSRGFWFEHALSGVTMPSPDGTKRQDAIRDMIVGQELFLQRKPTNKYDTNAIKVLDHEGRHVGFVSAKPDDWWGVVGGCAAWLSKRMDAGQQWRLFVRAVVGGKSKGKGSFGVRVVFLQVEGDKFRLKSRSPLREYAREPHTPFGSEAFALLGDLYKGWSYLTTDEQIWVKLHARAIQLYGGAPLEIRMQLKSLCARSQSHDEGLSPTISRGET
jgi:hypothetical protein